jgi:cellulose synthase/poly-beta-1,6-N-acetylglucosamine synthase-like glycosyltransferase
VTTLLCVVLWGSLACVGYCYVGYPLLIHAAACWHGRQSRSSPTLFDASSTSVPATLPSVTVLIAAHNSSSQIRARIQNILSNDYPAERLKIVVASDGSTDDTVGQVQRFDLPQVAVLPFAERRGKAATLMAAMDQIHSEVVVFTDASTYFDSSAVRSLAKHFGNPEIGIVSGKFSMLDEHGRPAESLYWKSEMHIRRSEAKLGLMMGASGAIYAMRRSLFVAPRDPITNDDLVFPILVHLTHRCKCILEESALAYAISSGGLKSEFQRRCRIGAGGFQALPVLSELFRFRNWRPAAVFVSHKLLRWISPFLLILVLVCNWALIAQPGYRLLFWLQVAAYGLAVLGLWAPNLGPITRLAQTASSFLVMNLALMTGFFQWLVDAKRVIWNPTPRPLLGSTPVPD